MGFAKPLIVASLLMSGCSKSQGTYEISVPTDFGRNVYAFEKTGEPRSKTVFRTPGCSKWELVEKIPAYRRLIVGAKDAGLVAEGPCLLSTYVIRKDSQLGRIIIKEAKSARDDYNAAKGGK